MIKYLVVYRIVKTFYNKKPETVGEIPVTHIEMHSRLFRNKESADEFMNSFGNRCTQNETWYPSWDGLVFVDKEDE